MENGGVFDLEDPENPDCKYWGYVLSDDKKERIKTDKFSHALYFRRKIFEKIAQEVFSLSSADVKSIWKEAPKFSGPYLSAQRRKARFKGPNKNEETKESIDAYVINIDGMNFLEENQKQLLLDLFPAASNEIIE